MRFENRVVIVTGGGQGIGAGCVQVFASEGARVAIFDIDVTRGQALAEALTSQGPGQVIAIQCDVSSTSQLQQAVEETVARFGHIDCLINNAGVHPPATSIEETSLDDLERLFRINFFSNYVATKLVLPYLRRTRGTIINMSSMTAVLGQHHSSAYAATKGAQLSLTKALALELGPQGIRVNAVLPSNVDTPLMREWAATLPDPDAALQRVSDLQVFGRMAAPEEIARVCLFLASEDSSFITGQGIEVEGGASLDY